MTSSAAIQRHYDIGDDFYALWLDGSMTYSGARWEDGDDLAAAQRRKLDLHIDALDLEPGARVLDVGCGWGSALARLVERVAPRRALGLTLSETQATFVSQLGLEGVEVRLAPWEELVDEEFDGILSIGAFEHFAPCGIGRDDKIARYGAFFERCHALLADGGRLSLQTIAHEDAEEDPTSRAAAFLSADIFPESSLPRAAEIAVAAEPWFRLVGLRADPDDYAATLRVWRNNLRAAKEQAVAVTDEQQYQRYQRYLKMSELAFRMRACTLLRLVFERRPNPLGGS